MKNIFLILSLIVTFSASGQVLNLDQIEFSIENIESGDYKSKLTSSGFELVSTDVEGKNGMYEKWVRKDNAIYVTIQHNDSFKFTKLLVSSADASSKTTIRNILDEVSKSYSKKTIDDQSYYLSEENPEMTIHFIKLRKEDKSIEGVMFFRKY